jgi:hypothetical protein
LRQVEAIGLKVQPYPWMKKWCCLFVSENQHFKWGLLAAKQLIPFTPQCRPCRRKTGPG